MLYIFGGFSGTFWLNDLVTMNLLTLTWSKPKVQGDIPSAREGHAMVAQGNYLYMHGGWEGTTISSMYRFDTKTMIWKRLNLHGPALCGHSITLVRDKLFIFGGFDSVNWVNTLYVYINGEWT
jgi:N-acetylneuraminic acid mutarotase